MKLEGCNRTICLEYEKGEFCLQFLPVEDRKDDLVEEVMNVVENCGGRLNEFAFERRKYAFDDESIPFEADWLVAHVSGACDMTQIPRKGSHYRCVFGTTSALWEVFCAKHGIRGPVWVEVTGFEPGALKCLSIPCFRLTNSFKLDVLHDCDKVPCFNVCSFAMQKVNDEIMMISAKMTADCHLMKWSDVSETITRTTMLPECKRWTCAMWFIGRKEQFDEHILEQRRSFRPLGWSTWSLFLFVLNMCLGCTLYDETAREMLLG